MFTQKKSMIVLVFAMLLLVTACTATESEQAGGFSVNDVTVSVEEIVVDKAKGKTEIVACLDLPDNGDWIPYASIFDGSEKIYSEQMMLVDYKNPETAETNHRCYRFIFPKAVTSQSVRFSIENLQTDIPENITEEICAEAQEKIRQEYPNFAFSCDVGNHSLDFEITEKPEGMGDEEAHLLIAQALTDIVNASLAVDVEVP